MIVYSKQITPRLQYIADFIGRETIGKPFELTDDASLFENYDGAKVNYSSSTIPNCRLSISNGQLLFESCIVDQKIECFEANGFKAFFKTTGDYSFDIFAASFYLLSRYEEYLAHKKDSYGRYAHENSLAHKEVFLNSPLINIWIGDFKKVLKEKYPTLTLYNSQFSFQPTYDIDEAFSYRHKGLLRTVGGMTRSFLNGKWPMMNDRIQVLNAKKQDPYDSYDWMDSLNTKHRLNPKYFFLVPEKNGLHDKNILPSNPAMRNLIKQHAEKYSIGIHPSWQSGDDDILLKKEIQTLEKITGKKITASRQHYLRFNLPGGYRRLIGAGIKDDYSMGYGTINGFRASVASPFYWYDLEKEQTTDLLLHPFCYMEANSFFEQKLTPEEAYDEMLYYFNVVRAVNGTLITLWHNTFLGTDKYYTGWRELYQRFIESIASAERT